MKRIIKFSLLLLALLLPAPVAATTTFYVGGIMYEGHEGDINRATVIFLPSKYSGDISIPATVTYGGITYTVTAIDQVAFRFCSGLTSIEIPSTVTYIGSNAFEDCTNLTSVKISDLTAWCKINFYAWYSNPLYYAHHLFLNGVEVRNMVIPNSVTSIGTNTFIGCTELLSVTIPNSVTSIGGGAFASCTGLTKVNISDLSSWCKIHFQDASANPLANANHLFLNGSEVTNLTIPNTVDSIGRFAFYKCYGLRKINIPNSVTFIGDKAFEDCCALEILNFNAVNCKDFIFREDNYSTLHPPFYNSSVSTINIGNNVQRIPAYFAYGLAGLTSITIPSSVTAVGNRAFMSCISLSTLNFNSALCASFNTGEVHPFYDTNISTINIGSSVQKVPDGFASGLSHVSSVNIPNSVKSIGNHAFNGCIELTSITIPNSVTSIEYNAFEGCTALNTLNFNADSCADFSSGSSHPFYNSNISMINIGNNVQRIPSYFANGLTGLTSITIPNSVNSIGNYAFQGCTSLATLIFNADSCADFGSGSSCPFYNLNISNLYIGNKVKKIPGYFAYGLNKLTSISIPNSVTSIGGYAFYGCSMLNSVNIGNSVTSIGNYTFYGCSGLSGLTIPNLVTSIGNSAFYGCNGLSSVFIPNSVTSIGNNAFQNCNGLSQVSISDITAWCGINFGSSTANPLYYAHHLYLNSAEVTDLVVPTTVDNIRNYAFYGCSGLTNLTIPNSVTSIGSSAFYGCSGLTNLTIPNSVTSIGNSAFQGCSALQTLIFNAESCNNFNSNSSYHPFYNLNISKINIGNSVVTIPAYFAYGLTKLTNVTIGNSVTSIGNNAFTGCTGLIRVDISDLAKWCRINFGSATTNPLFYAQHLYLNDNEVTNLVVPVDVDAIGNYAFYNCSLTSVKLHQSLASVGKQAFNNSPTIETVTCAATTPPSWNDLAMFTTNVFNHTPLYVPIGSERAYMIDQCWGQFATIIGKDIQNEILATSISLNQSQLSLQVGNTSQLIATVLPDSATNTSVTWLSNAPSVASVDENGLVTALAVGNATITATTTDGSNLSASCGVTVTEDLSEYDNYLSLNNLEASRGDTIVIPVTMTNTESIISFQTDIILPEGLELLKEDGEYIIDPSSRMTRTHSIMSNDVSSGAIRVLCYSSNYKPFTGNSGDDLFYITVKVADNAEGNYTIQLKNTLLTNTDFVDLAAPDVAANVNVKAYLLGDANNSGTVSITDVVVTAQYVLELNPQPFVFEAADANVDGNITVADVSRIAWMVLNPTLNAPLRAPALWNNVDRMSAEDITLAAGEIRRVSILLDNEMDYSAFQLDLNLPEGLTASNFQLTDRAGSHAFDVNTLHNGNIRALCYSPALTIINGHEGALLTFDVTAVGNVNGDITVDGIELVTANCQSVKLDAFTIGVNNATSVNESITGKAIAQVEYFNLAGQRMEQPSAGVTLIVTTYTDGSRTTTKIIK